MQILLVLFAPRSSNYGTQVATIYKQQHELMSTTNLLAVLRQLAKVV